MSFHCQKKIIRYHYCKHDASESYEFCGGDHEDTPEERQECWENQPTKKRNASTQITTTMEDGGVCCRDCDAEFIGFYCCNCQKFVEADNVSRNDENNLIHIVDDTEHEFCDDCYTKNY